MDALGLALLAVVLHVLVGVFNRPFQAFELDRAQLVPARCLDGLQSVYYRCAAHSFPFQDRLHFLDTRQAAPKRLRSGNRAHCFLSAVPFCHSAKVRPSRASSNSKGAGSDPAAPAFAAASTSSSTAASPRSSAANIGPPFSRGKPYPLTKTRSMS